MNIIVCLDDKGGMMFNRRRQSRDSLLRERILKLTQNSVLRMNEYSKKQFQESAQHIVTHEDFLDKAEKDDYCFVENVSVSPYENAVEKIIVYKWNKVYPADMYFGISLGKNGWKLISTFEFCGSSHEKITEEVYSR